MVIVGAAVVLPHQGKGVAVQLLPQHKLQRRYTHLRGFITYAIRTL